ncbi:DUF2079 domain-containing protein [Leptospira langatensis]|nr:DUF2079 domain-containing protein [Leptospira langatensis]
MGIRREILILSLVSIFATGTLSALQYLNLSFEWHDAGTMIHIPGISPSVHFLPSYEHSTNFLAEHFSPVFLLLFPYFQIFPYLEAWLIMQVFVIAFGICIFYLYCNEITSDSRVSLLASLALLLNPYLIHSHLYPHFEILYVFFLPLFLLLAVRNELGLSILALIGILIVKEDGWIYSICASVILLRKVRLKTVIIYISVSLLYFLLFIKLGSALLFPVRVDSFAMRWGKSETEYLKDLLFHPILYLKLLWSGQGKYLLLSVLGIPLLAGWRSIPGWIISILWMSSISLDRAFLSFYYGLPPLLILYASVPFAFVHIKDLSERLSRLKIPNSTINMTIATALLFVSVSLCIKPGTYISRGPNIAELSQELRTYQTDKLSTLAKLHSIRKECFSSMFVSFKIAPYLFCGNEIRIPYKDWEKVRKGEFQPELVVLATEDKEPLLQGSSKKEMIGFFDSNAKYARRENGQGLAVWIKK